MHSGSRRRRLYVEGKEGFHRARRAGESTSVRSSERTNPDTEKSTTTTSSVDEYMDNRGETRTRLPARRVRGRKGQRRVQRRGVKSSVRRKDSSRLPKSSTQWRKPEGYGEGWKAFWVAGSVAGAALVLSAYVSGLDAVFLRYLYVNNGQLPPDSNLEDRLKNSAAKRLSWGLHLLLVVAVSYLIKRIITWYKSGTSRGTGEKIR